MARKLISATAAGCLAVLCAATLGCGGGGEEAQKRLLANIYGTWTSPDDGLTIVLDANAGFGMQMVGPLANIPGRVAGRIFIKENSPDAKWKRGVYKIVGRNLVAGSTTEEQWSITLICDLGSGRLSLPGAGRRDVQLVRSARPATILIEDASSPTNPMGE
ncbi:MAG: hypothetical protein ACYTGB_05215 [Planctomycetota bacterium]|jgi:hypothetical protein